MVRAAVLTGTGAVTKVMVVVMVMTAGTRALPNCKTTLS